MTPSYLLSNILVPSLVGCFVGLTVYIATFQWGEWSNRRKYSKLGVLIIEMLQEEIRTGIGIISLAESVANNPKILRPQGKELEIFLSPPTKSWSGPQTIPDEVLLRISETFTGKVDGQLPATECRIHCKNYFDHICANYNQVAGEALGFLNTESGTKWKQPFLGMGNYHADTRRVYDMLTRAKNQLEENGKRWLSR